MYPPLHHMLRDLAFRLERGGGLVDRIHIPTPDGSRAAHGGVRPGILATGVDVVAAVVALRSLMPDWLATTELSLWTRDARQVGPIAGEATVLRSGRSNAVIEVNLFDAGAEHNPIALATATFARIKRPSTSLGEQPGDEKRIVVEFGDPDAAPSQPFVDGLGLIVADAGGGVVELPRSDYTANSFDSLQGGMVALLAELAAEAAASAAAGAAHAVLDLSVRYLQAGGNGPYRTSAKVLRSTPESIVTRVELHDRGADRCMAIAVATSRMVASVGRTGCLP